MTGRSIACAAVLVLLASGCASQHEESSRNEAAPASERDYDGAPEPEPREEEVRVAPEPAALADESAKEPRSLADIERELAANNAKLRELGVELPDRPTDAPAGGAAGSKSAPSGDGGRRATTAAPGRPITKPSEPKPESTPSKRDKSSSTATSKSSKSTGKAKVDAVGDDDLGPAPAKAAPRTPQGGLDVSARCEQVCDLAAISCGLGDQICELADRHPNESEYASACERANLDCEAAKEACDACVE